MVYGCEILGMSDSMARDAVRGAAAALTPPTAGKNPVLVMHAASIHSEGVNPNVAVNVEPIKAWTVAWWGGWATQQQLMTAHKAVKASVIKAQPNHWSIEQFGLS